MERIKRFFRVKNLNGSVFYGLEIRRGWIERIEGFPWGEYVATKELVPLDKVSLLAPVTPSKIIAVGLNYRDHIEEFGKSVPDEPVIFFKSITSLTGPGTSIQIPRASSQVDYEAELAIIIGHETWQVSESEAIKAIGGYTCLNDVTARDIQKKDGQWCRAKSYPAFCPIGPGITQGVNPAQLDIRLYQNGQLRQESNTSQLLFPVEQIVAFVSSVMPLYPQDIIATGTPSGVGPMQPGDRIEIDIEKVGRLVNNVS